MSNVLLVEDEQLLSDSYSLLLKAEGYLVDTAFNGKEALERCKANTYDIILLDIMMPVMDGLGFLKSSLKLRKKTSPVVLVLSNMSIGTEIEEALKLGARQFLIKSQLEPSKLLSIMKDELSLKV